ncbi:hypothetical protein BDW22DRAFT_1357020 [Trametopsis cervina]|nr:hypothetical protein BDW22DRAFT_1357020 [Trametopsis cervina]
MPSNTAENERPSKKRKLDRSSPIRTRSRDTHTPPMHDSGNEPELKPGIAAADERTPAPRLDRHPFLWFEDGSIIVVASDGLTFKLHASVLSHHSEVLKDLISALPNSAKRTLQLPERGADLAGFFEVLYDGHSYYNHDEFIEFDTLRLLLLVSIKYQVSHMVDSGFSRLQAFYPSDYDYWTEWVHRGKPYGGSVGIECEDSIAVIEIARAAGRTDLLPVALYVCTLIPWESFLEGIQYGPDIVQLSVEDQMLCLNALRDFRAMSARISDVFLTEALRGPGAHCRTQVDCRKAYRELALAATRSSQFADLDCFESSTRLIEKLEAVQARKRCKQGSGASKEAVQARKRCSRCVRYLKEKIEERRREEWNTLGEVFNIPDWPPRPASLTQ